MKNKVLELFAGRQSFSNVAQEKGFETFCSDIEKIDGIDYVCNIFDFDVKKVPFIPNIIWASPDCSAWSCAAGKTHFDTKSLKPKTEKAATAFKMVDKTLEIINFFLALNPDLKFYIENPVGKMQYYIQAGTLFGNGIRLVTIDQCQYGREHQKRTHIFTNDYTWKPRPRCPGRPECSHLPNIKEMKTGHRSSLGCLDGKRYYERAKIPRDLCLEILQNNQSK